LLDGWREQQMTTGLEQFLLVGGEGARVLVEVFASTELQRIDENAADQKVRPLGGFGHQCNVAAVQVAHGRHKGNALAFATGAGHGGPQFAYGFYGVHAENPCSIPGKVAALTSVT